jgi:hypothetical protein
MELPKNLIPANFVKTRKYCEKYAAYHIDNPKNNIDVDKITIQAKKYPFSVKLKSFHLLSTKLGNFDEEELDA